MSDTLTTLNWLHDQRRYMAASPLADRAVLFLRDVYARELSRDGQALCLRLLQAILATTTEIEPTTTAPISQRVLYGLIRRAIWYTYLAIGAAEPRGDAEPILSEAGLAALIGIETQDPIISTPTGRTALLTAVFDGLAWRASTIDLGVDARSGGMA